MAVENTKWSLVRDGYVTVSSYSTHSKNRNKVKVNNNNKNKVNDTSNSNSIISNEIEDEGWKLCNNIYGT